MQKRKTWELLAPQKTILAYPDEWDAHAQTIQVDDAVVVQDAEGRKMVKAGTVYPANDATAKGIILHDYYFDFGDVHAALVYRGVVRADRIEELEDAAKAVLPRITVLEAVTEIPNEVDA